MMKKTKSTTEILLLISLVWASVKCDNEVIQRGYILTAPWVLNSDSSEILCLTLHGIESSGTISVKLDTTKGPLAKTTQSIQNGESQCFDMKVGSTTASEAILSIFGTFEDGYTFNNQKIVQIRQEQALTLIQTDKHFYQASQKVQFRVLHLNSAFLPKPDYLRSISITNPFNVKVTEWSSPSSESGLTDLSFELSEKPQLGTWTISVEDQKKQVTNQTFKVAEYDLPRFFVRISTPSIILPDFAELDWKVCAYYTYGEPVIGQIKANITRISNQKQNAPPLIILNDEFRECRTMKVHKSDLKLERNDIRLLNTLNFYAEVTEKGTEIKISDFRQVQVRGNQFNLYLLSKQYFKPGLPYIIMILLENDDRIPAEGQQFQLDIKARKMIGTVMQTWSQLIITNNHGHAQFTIPPQADNIQAINLKITAVNNPVNTYNYYGFRQLTRNLYTAMNKPVDETIKSWYSPSNSFIQIERPKQPLKCKTNTDVTLHFTWLEGAVTNDITLYYQIKARNNVLTQKKSIIRKHNNWSVAKAIHSTTITITVDPVMSPKAELLVYYIRNDGEIVSDSETLEVNECFANEVDMKFSKFKILPGSRATLNVSADSNSLCAIGMKDKSTQLLSDHEFNVHKVFTALSDRQPHMPVKTTEIKCSKRDPNLELNTNLLGSQKAFDNIGMLTLTNLVLESSPCLPIRLQGNENRKTFSANDLDIWNLQDMENLIVNGRNDEEEEWDERSQPQVELRNYFPETWLWELVRIGANKETSIERDIPHTITKWTGDTICVSPVTGLGISPKTSIISFQAMFLTFTMPYAVKYEETVPLIVTVFNYLKGCYPIALSLESNINVKIVSHSSVAYLCVCGGKSYSHKYHIQPLKIGHVNVTVSANAMNAHTSTACAHERRVSRVMAYDAITKPLLVKAEGLPKEKSHSNWICVNGIKKSHQYSMQMPSDGIRGSEKMIATVTGDIIAPTIKHITNLIDLPKGCGEQNMIRFAPLIYIVHYLRTTNQLTDAINKTATDYMLRGYQNQLNYRRNDGSYSIWGKRDPAGSTWLTAFVIKSLAMANSMIYINPIDVQNGINFIVKNQAANGCYTETKDVSNRRGLQGGIGEGDKSPQAFTSFVAIALLEAGLGPSNNTVQKAIQCIETDKTPTNNYRLAMKAYAMALANHADSAKLILSSLEKSAIIGSDETAHWINNQQSSRALKIEITSYVLLAMTTLQNYHSELAIKAVRWLVNQRNAHGGFVSTQDTVLALQALEKFASQMPKRRINVAVVLKAHHFEHVINVNEANKLETQTKHISISSARNNLEATVNGEGCALVQVTLKYLTRGAQTTPALYLDVTVLPFEAQDNNNIQNKQMIKICTRYQLANGATNMAVLKIEMVSGYEADTGHLDKLINPGAKLSRWELGKDGAVLLYFDTLTNQLECVTIVVKETAKVENRKPAIVKVYDYYKPEMAASREYSLLYKPTNELLGNTIQLA